MRASITPAQADFAAATSQLLPRIPLTEEVAVSDSIGLGEYVDDERGHEQTRMLARRILVPWALSALIWRRQRPPTRRAGNVSVRISN